MFSKSIATKGGDVFRDEFSVAFDGTNDYLALNGSFSYTTHSISTWVKFADDSVNKTIFDYRDANDDGIHLYVSTSEQLIYQVNAVDGHYTQSIAPNVWHHVVATNDGTTSKIYLNGDLVETANTSSTTINVSGAEARIGARSHTSASNYYQGNISELAFYTSALTANQVKTIYNGREPYNHKEGVASNYLHAWYRMGDGALDERNSDTFITNSGIIADEVSSTLSGNLVTNGTFDADSGWTKEANWSIGSGVASVSEGSSSFGTSELSQNFGGSADKIYKVSFDMTSYTAGFLNFKLGSTIVGYGHTSTGHVYGYGKAATSAYLIFDDGGPGAITCSIDNVKVQEVTGKPALFVNMGKTDIEGDTP